MALNQRNTPLVVVSGFHERPTPKAIREFTRASAAFHPPANQNSSDAQTIAALSKFAFFLTNNGFNVISSPPPLNLRLLDSSSSLMGLAGQRGIAAENKNADCYFVQSDEFSTPRHLDMGEKPFIDLLKSNQVNYSLNGKTMFDIMFRGFSLADSWSMRLMDRNMVATHEIHAKRIFLFTMKFCPSASKSLNQISGLNGVFVVSGHPDLDGCASLFAHTAVLPEGVTCFVSFAGGKKEKAKLK